MQAFAYAAPHTVGEAVELLARKGARALAGGTDLLAQMKEGRAAAELVVDIKRIPELNRWEFDPVSGLRLGAAVPASRLWQDPAISRAYPALAYCASLIGSWQIQNRATLGGNLCNASPAADGVPALMVYGARAVVAGPAGQREVPVADFCTAPGRTVLQPGELLLEFRVPVPPDRWGAAYRRFTPREEMDIAVVGVGAGLGLDPGGRCTGVRIALAAVAPTPVQARAAEELLAGQAPTDALLDKAAAAAVGAARPISDVRGSADYRLHLVKVLAGRVLREALVAARGA